MLSGSHHEICHGDPEYCAPSSDGSENAEEYIDIVDLFMVATGINFDNDFYNIDPSKLKNLMNTIQNQGKNYEYG